MRLTAWAGFASIEGTRALSMSRALSALLQFYLSVGRTIRIFACCGDGSRVDGVGGVAFDGHAVGVLDGAEPGGYPGLAGGDGLAVAAAVGAFGQGLAEAFDFADVGFAFVGVRGDGEDGDAGGGGVEDEADGLAVGVAAGQGDDRGPSVSGQACSGCAAAVPGPVVEVRRA